MAEVDSLEISIEASATKAVERVTELIKKLEELKAAYTNVPNNSFGGGKGPKVPGPPKSTKQDYSSLREIIASVGKEMANMKPKALQAAKAAAQASNALRSIGGEKFNPSVSQVSDTLDSLSASLKSTNALWGSTKSNVQATANTFAMLPPNIQRAVLANAKMQTSNTKTAKSFGLLGTGISGSVAKFGIYAAVFGRIAGIMGGRVKSANDYIEATNLFSVSMGDYYDEALAYAELVNQKMGIDITKWMDAQGTFKLMADGFGIAEDQAYELSKGLTELAYDISSLKNIDPVEAVTKLRSALAGELEPIRALGLSISQATLQEYALSKGIKEAVTSMTEQEKALLRSVKVMEDAKRIGYVGDFAKTLESPANAMRILKQQITEMGRAIGTVLLPAITQMLPWIQAFVSLLTDAIKALATFVGFTMPEWDTSSWKSTDFGFGETEEAIGGATSAVKEFKRQLMGIDELTVLQEPSADGGGGTGGASDWANNLEIPKVWNDQMLKEIQTKSEKIKSQMESLLPIIAAVGAGLLAWKLGPALFSGIKHLGELLGLALGRTMVLTEGATKLAKALKFAGAASVIAIIVGRFIDLYQNSELFRTGLERIGEIFTGVFNLGKDVLLGIWGTLKDIGMSVLNLLPEEAKVAVLDGLQAISDFLGKLDLDWKDLLITIGGLALLFVPGGKILGAVLLGFEAITLIIRGIGLISDETWETIKTGTVQIVEAIKEFVVGAFESVLTFMTGIFTRDFAKVWDGIQIGVSAVLDLIGSLTKTLFGVDIVDVVSTWFQQHVAPWFTLARWQELGNNIKTAITTRFNEFVTSWKSKITSWWNNDVKPWFSITKWKELGNAALEGLFKGLSNIGNKIKTWGGNLVAGVKNFFDISSPSKLFRDDIGINLGLGISEGFASSEKAILNSVASVTGNVKNAFTGLTADIQSASMPAMPSHTYEHFISNKMTREQIVTATYQPYANEGNDASTGDIISTLMAITQRLVTAIEENSGTPVYINGQQITNYQNNANRMYGRTQQNV